MKRLQDPTIRSHLSLFCPSFVARRPSYDAGRSSRTCNSSCPLFCFGLSPCVILRLIDTNGTRKAEKRTVEELQFEKRFKTDVPNYPEEGSQVRLNAAAIFREDALLKRKQGQDAELIKVPGRWKIAAVEKNKRRVKLAVDTIRKSCITV